MKRLLLVCFFWHADRHADRVRPRAEAVSNRGRCDRPTVPGGVSRRAAAALRRQEGEHSEDGVIVGFVGRYADAACADGAYAARYQARRGDFCPCLAYVWRRYEVP